MNQHRVTNRNLRGKPPPHQRRRFSKMQAASLAAISAVVLLQVGFVILFPLWQRNETVEVVVPAPRVELPSPPPVEKVAEPPSSPPAPVEVVKEVDESVPVTAEVMAVEEKREDRVLVEEKREEVPGPVSEPKAEAPLASVAAAPAAASQLPGFVQEQEARAAIAEARASMERVAEDVSGRMEMTAAEQRIRILDVERERFQASAEYDELRLLRIRLRPLPELAPVEGSEVRVTVEFFDRVHGTGEVVSSLMRVQTGGLKIEGVWPAGEARTVSASYVVPKGYRQREVSLLGERRAYEGFRVSVFYRGKLQDRQALPRELLNIP